MRYLLGERAKTKGETVKGQPVRFALSDHPVITFENNQLVVTTTAETVSMPVAEISVGGFTDNADACIDWRQHRKVSLADKFTSAIFLPKP